MVVLGLDISTSSGWALRRDGKIVEYGVLATPLTLAEYGKYPWNYLQCSTVMASSLMSLVLTYNPDVVVIEEINLGKNRYTQKILEWIHRAIVAELRHSVNLEVIYLSSSTWRQALGLTMSKLDKKNNAKLAKAKRLAIELGAKVDKKTLGIAGKVNKKHIAIRYVNETYGLKLKVKDDDIADAICLTEAYEKNATPCDGLI